MKILHLSTNDINGGAARGAYWLHQGMIKAGVDSTMLVAQKKSDDFTVIGEKSKFQKGWNLIRPTIDSIPMFFYPNRHKTVFSSSWISAQVHRQIENINPDIINLHWVCGSFLKPESLARFNKPIVWTLRDMWAFTGGCHYAGNCEKYKVNCGACPQLGSESENDISRKLWQRKQKAWQDLNITIVAISNWLAECASNSSLFKDKRIEVIPNALDECKFKPIPKKIAREILNLPLDKNIILFGAINAVTDKRKGYQYLIPALKHLSSNGLSESKEIVVFGSGQPKEEIDLGMKVHYVGKLHDDTTLALTYSAADVTVTPSIQEAFGKTAMESLACGTPVVAFNATGLKDIVDHQQNGYLAKPFDVEDLAKGIVWVLENINSEDCKLGYHAREKVEREFTLEIQGRRYLSIYESIIE
ncbi:MAG: glycosyltransferase [Richelia sp. RM2_1_2]|nr:glycosyltransferase [Richelia sp. RM2_1_2]